MESSDPSSAKSASFGSSLGLANKAVARELGIIEGALKIHLHNTFRKLGIRNRMAVLRIAIGEGSK